MTFRGFVCRIGLLRNLILMCKSQTLFRNCKINSLICVCGSRSSFTIQTQKPASQCNVNTAAKYQKLYAAVEPCLLGFSISYMLEAGVSHANAFLNQRNRLNQEDRGDLQVSQLCPTHGLMGPS